MRGYRSLHSPPFPTIRPQSKRQLKVDARQLRKLERAEELQQVLVDLTASNIPLIFTDGSSAVEQGAGRVARHGNFHQDYVAIAACVPDDFRQTNNSAELLAALRALQNFTTGKIALCRGNQTSEVSLDA